MKELLECINKCNNEEELNNLANNYIDYYTEESKNNNIDSDTLGIYLDVNSYIINSDNFEGLYVWNGYIPKNTRIVYGEELYGKRGSNIGCYYYLDDESYILEFFKYIKNKEVLDTYDLILYVNKFLRNYLDKSINPSDRDDIHRVLIKNNETYYEPIKKHSIKDFIGNGSAKCSEYAALTENIFSIFGFDMYYLMDEEHVYNILIDNEKHYLLDYVDWVSCYDTNYKLLAKLPYYVEIKDFSYEFFEKVIYGDEKFILPDYYIIGMNDDLVEIKKDSKRIYGIDGIREEVSLKLTK